MLFYRRLAQAARSRHSRKGLHLSPPPDCSFVQRREKEKDNPVPSQDTELREHDEARLGKRPRSTARNRGPSIDSSSPGRRRIGPQAGEEWSGLSGYPCMALWAA